MDKISTTPQCTTVICAGSFAWTIAVLAFASCINAYAGEADVFGVEATLKLSGDWRFDVAVSHSDEGWDHYADRWDILTPDGTILGERVLLHPHVDEQPFTRSLNSVTIPEDIDEVIVRAHDSLHGLGGEEFRLKLNR